MTNKRFCISARIFELSWRHLVRVRIIATAKKTAESSGNNAYKLKSSAVGRTITSTPLNPKPTASHDLRPTRSPLNNAENSVMNNGIVYNTEAATDNGICGNAA